MKQIGNDIELYAKSVHIYDRYPERYKPIVYFLGLSGEVGELIEAVDQANDIENKNDLWRKQVIAELGDVFWYWCALANNLSIDYKSIWNLVYSETYSRQSFHDMYKNDIHSTEILKIVICVGRIIEHLKKSYRDDDGKITPQRLEKIEQKFAEMLEHIFGFCALIDVKPYDVLQNNYAKLYARNEAGTIQGEGDGITKDERT
jgi:NTP pyrophosphatase (non-canonical NTP hydrolase)